MTTRLTRWSAASALILTIITPAISQTAVKIDSPATLPQAQVGVDYSVTLQVKGGQAPYAWLVSSGSLPPGLSLFPLTGVISGRPTAPGTSSFRVIVTDLLLGTDNQNFTIVTQAAAAPPTISTTTLPAGTAGTSYSQTLSATGGTTPYSWSVSAGNLPPGVTLSTA